MSNSSQKSILFLSSLIFFLLGLFTATIGPILPQLAENARVGLETIGAVFLGVYIGGLAAQLVTGPVGDRIGHQWMTVAAMLLMATGILGLGFSRSLGLTLLLASLAGLGHGGVTLSGNVFVATTFGGKSVSALNLVNVFFGLGAFFGPTFVSLSHSRWQTGVPVLWLTSALLLVSTLFFARLRVPLPVRSGGRQSASGRRSGVYRSPLLWGLSLMILVYVGAEIGMGGWTTTYMERTAGLPLERAALITAGFWLALTAGRLVSSGLGMRISSWNILTLSLLGSALSGSLLAFSSGSLVLTVAAVLGLGFSFGAVYPTSMAITTSIFHREPGRAASIIAAMGSIGGALLPWLQGITLERVSEQGSAWFTFSLTLLMVILLVAIRTWRGSQAAVQAGPAVDAPTEGGMS